MDEISQPGSPGAASEFEQTLKRRTLRSIVWTMAQAAGDQLFSFVVFVLIARLLDKPAIGTFAIAFVFMDIGRNLASAGVMQRVARIRESSPGELDTIFWTNLTLAAAYSLLVIAAAPAAQKLFGAPQLQSVLVWLTIPILLSGGANTHMALRLREFGHRTLALRSVLGGLLGGTCAVVAALLGAGIWALVIQRLVRELVCAILAWTSYPWRPGISLDFGEARKQLKSGLDLGFAQVVTLLSFRAQDLGIAKVLGPAPLSSYRVAWRCAELIGPQVVGPFATVALQTFSRLEDQGRQLRATYMSMLQQCAIVSIPALVGYSVAGPWLVPALFGPQWQDAGAIAPMLLPLALPFTIGPFVVALLAAHGRIAWQRHLSLVDLLSTILVTVFTVSFGLKWLALAYSIRSLLLIPLQLHLARKVAGITARDHFRALAAPLAATSAMGIAAVLLFNLSAPANLLTIFFLCCAVAALYALLIGAILPDYRRRAQSFLASRMRTASSLLRS